MNIRAGSCFLFAVFSWAASGCAGTGVTGDQYALVANPPGLKYVTPMITNTEHDRYLVDRFQWTFTPGGWPAADLVFVRMKDVYRGSRTFVHSKSLPEQVKIHFPNRSITTAAKGTTKNFLGDLDYQHFSLDTVADCIFIQQGISRFADQVEVNSGADPLGDMIVRGWYCAKSSDRNQGALFREFIANIGIHGYAVPGGD